MMIDPDIIAEAQAETLHRDALRIQEALAKQGIGEDQISLHQISLALQGQHMLWDEAGAWFEHRMKVEAGEHLTLVRPDRDDQ
jgi:hypothetical protein